MPEPAAPAPPAAPKVAPSPELDKAFERALRHGDLRQLRKALASTEPAQSELAPPPEERAPAPSPEEPPPAEVTEEPTDPAISEPAVAPEELPPAPAAAMSELYAELQGAVALAARWSDDPVNAEEALRTAREPLEALIARLESWEAPPLVLPPFRQSWALAVVPPPDGGRLADLAAALEIDMATARQVGLARHPRVALRGADPDDLEQRAARYRERLGLPAAVLDEHSLRAQPPARLLLTLTSEGPWRSAWSPSWEPDAGTLAALEVRVASPPEPCLVVVGELVFTRYREHHGRRKDDVRLARHGDRRLAVLDLHHDHGLLRVVEGITRLDGYAGLDASRSALAFRGLPEALAARFPGVPVVERCICRPTRTPAAGDDGRLEASGWPEWEAHSRTCRVLFGVG